MRRHWTVYSAGELHLRTGRPRSTTPGQLIGRVLYGSPAELDIPSSMTMCWIGEARGERRAFAHQHEAKRWVEQQTAEQEVPA